VVTIGFVYHACQVFLKMTTNNFKSKTLVMANKLGRSFHEQKYECFDVKLDKQYQQHYSFKNFNDQYIVLVSVPELPLITFIQKRQTIPIFSCRGGPPILTQSLRGPPLV
jgi:hypothetical protein